MNQNSDVEKSQEATASSRYMRIKVEKGITRRQRTDGTGDVSFDVQVWVNRSARSKTLPTLSDARRWRDEMLGERAKGQIVMPADRRITVGQFVSEVWIPWLEEEERLGSLRRSTVSWYKGGSQILVPEIGRLRLIDVGKQSLRGMLSRRVAAGDSQSRLRYLRATTRSVLGLAVELDLLNVDPSDFMVGRNAPKALRAPVVGPVAWSQSEARTFLASIKGDRLEALWVLLLSSGLRRGEALALRWSDIEIDTGAISVERSWIQVEGVPMMSVPKTARSIRIVNVGSSVTDSLRSHRRLQAQERLLAEGWLNEDDLVFTGQDGSPLRPDFATKRLKNLVKVAGLEWIRLHGLRHTMASLALQNGTDIATVSQRLGHSDTSVTTRVYLHGSEESDRAAGDLIDDVLHG